MSLWQTNEPSYFRTVYNTDCIADTTTNVAWEKPLGSLNQFFQYGVIRKAKLEVFCTLYHHLGLILVIYAMRGFTTQSAQFWQSRSGAETISALSVFHSNDSIVTIFQFMVEELAISKRILGAIEVDFSFVMRYRHVSIRRIWVGISLMFRCR